MDKEHDKLLEDAHELVDFFLGTYAEQTLTKAIESGDKELLRITVSEFMSQRQLIEDAELDQDEQEEVEHWGCGKQECDCDDQYQEMVDNELSHA